MVNTKDIGSKMKTEDGRPTPPGFASLTSFTLKRRREIDEPSNRAGTQSDIDVEKLQKSVKRRPWILNDQLSNLGKPDTEHPNKNLSMENTLPKGVIINNNWQKVFASWCPEESCRPSIDYTHAFHPSEEEFKDIYQYVAKIRPKAEEYGICRIIPPDSWKPPPIIQGNKLESCRFGTRVQQIDELKSAHSKRKLNEIIQRDNLMELDHGTNGFEFECGTEFNLRTFKIYAEQFKRQYFLKGGIFTNSKSCEDVEGEYWRIVENPTHQIQVLSGHNLEAKVLGSGFPLPPLDDDDDDQTYMKSHWNLNKTPMLPGSLLAFDCDNSALLTPRLDVGMCFSSICWKVEEHHLYSLNYLHLGASRILYGVPGKYRLKCEALLKKTFPELSRHRELVHQLVAQLSPSTLKAEGIPVYRCVQNPKQFVLVFPGAYYSGFDTGFSVSEKVNLAPLDWLPHGQLTVEIYSELHRKTSISYDRLLMEGVINAAKSPWDFRMRGWHNACGKDGWLTRALKSRVRQEGFKREFLCNASQSRKMEKDFGGSVKKECIICFYDLYLSAAGCQCSPDKYSCLEHSKQICACPWSSRFFLYRYDIGELNLLINALEGKVSPK